MKELLEKYLRTPKPYSEEDEKRIIQEQLANMPCAVQPVENSAEKLAVLDRMIASTGIQRDDGEYGEEIGVNEELVVPDDQSEPLFDDEILKKEALLKAIQAKLNME